MGWKGNVRSVKAAIRASERESARRQRELEKQRKQQAKMQEIEYASVEVEIYENYIELIQSIHKDSSNLIDWQAILTSPKPEEPKLLNHHESSFKPKLVNKLLRNQDKAKQKEIEKDHAQYEARITEWKQEVSDWEQGQYFASKLYNSEHKVKLEIIEFINPFSEIEKIGSHLTFVIDENGILEAELVVLGNEIVPTEIKSQLKSGKLSTKKMPKGRFNEIYQDYVCSAVLRVGNELLALLPDDMVFVHAYDNLLNKKTGHIEKQCILSVAISRNTIASLNMDFIDPSDSMDNFVHNMNFKKTNGFASVETLKPSTLI